MVGYYRARNEHRSLAWAIQKEKEWDLIKPKEEEYDDEEDEESGDEGGEAPAAEGGDDEEEEWGHHKLGGRQLELDWRDQQDHSLFREDTKLQGRRHAGSTE